MKRLVLCILTAALPLGACAPAPEAPGAETPNDQGAPVSTPRNGSQPGGMKINASGNVVEGAGKIEAAAKNGHGIVRVYVVLDHPGQGVSPGLSAALEGILRSARGVGVRVFPRFYYESPVTSKQDAAATAQKIASDIKAAAPIVNRFTDVIPFVQAGFLGPWGEWWGGDLEGADLGDDAALRALKTGVVDAWKQAVPGLPVQMRYPRDIATYYPDDARVAFHDDAVLAADEDDGTFHASRKTKLWPDGDPQAQRSFIKERSQRLGSINAGESDEKTAYTDCGALLAYLRDYRIFVFNTEWPGATAHCADVVKAQLLWDQKPSTGGGSTGVKVLGCWASDQRPWQQCITTGCPDPTCKRSSSDQACSMLRTSSCVGTWPPPGYPGEESAP